MSQTEKVLKFDDREIILIGTAHISQESCNEVKKAVEEKSPDCVAIELDEGRYKSLNNPEDWKNLDIVKVLKANQGFLFDHAVYCESKRNGDDSRQSFGDSRYR